MPKSQFFLHPDNDVPIHRMDCPADLKDLAEPDAQARMRDFYHAPGILVLDDAIDPDWIERLRTGLSDQPRAFMDAFIDDKLPENADYKDAWKRTRKRIKRIGTALFGYELPMDALAHSIRNMLTTDEPLHFDTYPVECGTFPVMGGTNFDVKPRIWRVGPNFPDACADDLDWTEAEIAKLAAGKSAGLPMRTKGLKGEGPLRPGIPLHEVHFAPGSVWFANPKTLAHQIYYGNGVVFCQWDVREEGRPCACQNCTLDALGIPADHLRIAPQDMASADAD